MSERDPQRGPDGAMRRVNAFAQRWQELEQVERDLAAIAIAAMLDGDFAEEGSWSRYCAATVRLLPTLWTGSRRAFEVHAEAYRRCRMEG
jgi:hypothetical protein